nr:hypothetical protein [uncultured Sphingomonas sp.]
MADITMAVTFSSGALAMSLVFLTRVAAPVVRAFACAAMALLAVHALGVQVTAPVPEATAEVIADVAFGWLMTAVLAVCVRGALRMLPTNPPHQTAADAPLRTTLRCRRVADD